MKKPVAVLLLFVVSATAQSVKQQDGIPVEQLFPGAEVIEKSPLPSEASLRLDLLAQKRATLQARAEWIETQRQLLSLEMKLHNEQIDAFQLEFNEKFKCAFDLDKRQCRPGSKKPDPEKPPN